MLGLHFVVQKLLFAPVLVKRLIYIENKT